MCQVSDWCDPISELFVTAPVAVMLSSHYMKLAVTLLRGAVIVILVEYLLHSLFLLYTIYTIYYRV